MGAVGQMLRNLKKRIERTFFYCKVGVSLEGVNLKKRIERGAEPEKAKIGLLPESQKEN